MPGGIFGRFFSARPEGSPYPKAELLPRLLARLTDLMLAAILPLTFGEPGGILAALYLLFADGMLRGQSPGKRLLGIKVMHVAARREADYRESALRNFPFALVVLLHALPVVGSLLSALAALALLVVEGGRAAADLLGLRGGDLLAGTQVVDAKAIVAQKLHPVLKAVRSDGAAVRAVPRAVLGPISSPRRVA